MTLEKAWCMKIMGEAISLCCKFPQKKDWIWIISSEAETLKNLKPKVTFWSVHTICISSQITVGISYNLNVWMFFGMWILLDTDYS